MERLPELLAGGQYPAAGRESNRFDLNSLSIGSVKCSWVHEVIHISGCMRIVRRPPTGRPPTVSRLATLKWQLGDLLEAIATRSVEVLLEG